jgi:hypothetical protein
MALTTLQIKNTRATDKSLKLSAGRGLFLLIQPNKTKKYWRLAYRFNGKQKTLALGVFPDVSLDDACGHREEARKLLKAGIDPSENRKAIKFSKANQNANSFEIIAREWLTKKSPTWAPSHTDKVISRLERDIFSFPRLSPY